MFPHHVLVKGPGHTCNLPGGETGAIGGGHHLIKTPPGDRALCAKYAATET